MTNTPELTGNFFAVSALEPCPFCTGDIAYTTNLTKRTLDNIACQNCGIIYDADIHSPDTAQQHLTDFLNDKSKKVVRNVNGYSVIIQSE